MILHARAPVDHVGDPRLMPAPLRGVDHDVGLGIAGADDLPGRDGNWGWHRTAIIGLGPIDTSGQNQRDNDHFHVDNLSTIPCSVNGGVL